jgi:mono/diheme cytochrome c family protein
MAALGALAGFGLQYWATAVAYPLKASGKPVGAWIPFLPVAFEVTVLFSAGTAALAMLFLLNRLPAFGHPLLDTHALRRATRDRYALALGGDPGACGEALREAGAEAVEAVIPRTWRTAPLQAAGFVAVASALAGAAAWAGVKLYPVIPPMVRMEAQPRLDPQDPSRFFGDGRGMRAPVEGTVARGNLPPGVATEAEAERLVNPLPVTAAVLAEGRTAFQERCAACHGPLGDGQGTLTRAYGASPADLHADRIRGVSDGHLWWVILKGRNAMPGHEAYLDSDRRWALVHYVRALQRARHATDEDLEAGP